MAEKIYDQVNSKWEKHPEKYGKTSAQIKKLQTEFYFLLREKKGEIDEQSREMNKIESDKML